MTGSRALHGLNGGLAGTFPSGTLIAEVDLASNTGNGFYNGSQGSGNSGFFLSDTLNSKFDDETEFTQFKYRSGSFLCHTDDQVTGWNFIHITHEVDSTTTHSADIIEWVNDPSDTSGEHVTATSFGITPFTMGGSATLSGIKYFTNFTCSYSCSLADMYRTTYSTSTSAITIDETQGNMSLDKVMLSGSGFNPEDATDATLPLPALLDSVSSPETTEVGITASFNNTTTKNVFYGNNHPLNNDFEVRVDALHPLDNVSNTGTETLSDQPMLLLVDVDNSTTDGGVTDINDSEQFNNETYRIQRGSAGRFLYDTQADADHSDTAWDSTRSVDDITETGHMSGLVVYRHRLMAPVRAGNNGEFSGAFIPTTDQVDYSGTLNYTGPRVYM